MRKRAESHFYSIVGSRAAEFPLTMLQFSRSWPANDEAVRLIGLLTLPLEAPGRDAAITALDRRVEIRLGTIGARDDLSFTASLRRWESFGWIVKIEGSEADPDYDPAYAFEQPRIQRAMEKVSSEGNWPGRRAA